MHKRFQLIEHTTLPAALIMANITAVHLLFALHISTEVLTVQNTVLMMSFMILILGIWKKSMPFMLYSGIACLIFLLCDIMLF